jgi:hypothetical protein
MQKMKTIRLTAFALMTAVGAGLLSPVAAHASWKGKRNTAYALGAVGVYGLATKKPLIGALGLGGGIYQYLQANKEKRRERDRDRRRALAWRRYRSTSARQRVTRRYTPRRSYSRVSGYRSAYSRGHAVPPGWSRGKKVGWYKH